MLKGISSLARRRHEFSARRNLTGTVVLESIVLAGSKMRKKKSRGEKFWESLRLLGHKWMNNVSALSVKYKHTMHYQLKQQLVRSATAKTQTSTHTMLWDFLSAARTKKRFETPTNDQSKHFKMKLNSPGVYEEIVQFDWCKEVFTTKFRLLVSCHCHRWLACATHSIETPGVNSGFNNRFNRSVSTIMRA